MSAARKISYILLFTAIVAAIWWINRPAPVEVEIHTVTLGKVESTIANTRTGTIMACRRSHIVPITSGRVDQLMVNEGDQVQQGQLLLSLWNEDLSAQVDLADVVGDAVQSGCRFAGLHPGIEFLGGRLGMGGFLLFAVVGAQQVL